MLGSLAIVLHAHIPYVLGHGRWPHGVDWLNEAVAETYLPLLGAVERLRSDGIAPHLTVSVTPVLAEQLADPRYPGELATYLDVKRQAAASDETAFRRTGLVARASVAALWERFYANAAEAFTSRHGSDVVGGLRAHQDDGAIEVMTSGATHGYLPLLGTEAAVRAQIRQGTVTYRRHFGRPARGVWLPECAYRPRGPWRSFVDSSVGEADRPGVDEVLADEGLRWFVVDSHLVRGGRPLGVYRTPPRADARRPGAAAPDESGETGGDVHRPYWVRAPRAGDGGVAVVARDPSTALQVWSGDVGYPGDPAYLEFHKKHFPGGLRYWSVTSRATDLAEKAPYDPAAAALRVREHAAHFVSLVKATLARHGGAAREPGLVVAPFDAELFGHWWFEGPDWLEQVVRLVHGDPDLEMTTVSGHLDRHPPAGVVSLPEGSWGEGGGHRVWLNDETLWVWRRVHAAEQAMTTLAREALATGDPILARIGRQAARELFLLEASDWPFLITTWGARDYAEQRVAAHADAFERLVRSAEGRRATAGGETRVAGDVVGRDVRQRLLPDDDRAALEDLEFRDRLFPDLDLSWWAGSPLSV